MNKARRKKLNDLLNQIDLLKDELNCIKDEEREYYDNIPENFADSDRANESNDAIDSMENAWYSLDEAVDHLNTILEA